VRNADRIPTVKGRSAAPSVLQAPLLGVSIRTPVRGRLVSGFGTVIALLSDALGEASRPRRWARRAIRGGNVDGSAELGHPVAAFLAENRHSGSPSSHERQPLPTTDGAVTVEFGNELVGELRQAVARTAKHAEDDVLDASPVSYFARFRSYIFRRFNQYWGVAPNAWPRWIPIWALIAHPPFMIPVTALCGMWPTRAPVPRASRSSRRKLSGRIGGRLSIG
jgi:hypothetical protein